jgi:hypothetical protein
MKKIIVFAVFILATCGFASAQTPRALMDTVREIKLLESDRDDVKRILKDYEASDDDDYFQEFDSDDATIEISYASGNCYAQEDEDSDKWKVAEWKVTKIEVNPDKAILVEDIGYDLTKFKKEKKYNNVRDSYVYHDKDSGIAFEVYNGWVETIYFFPSGGNSSMLCDNNEAAKTFYASESWFGKTDSKDRILKGNTAYGVTALNLSASEIIIGCGAQDKTCLESSNKIEVTTVSSDPDNDVLTFNYTVSGGEVIGRGAKVVWDLTGVEPGTYTIKVEVDDGCGVCGTKKTQTVVVKKCENCKEKSDE